MKKGTKHSPESLEKMHKPKTDEARAHMRQPKSEAMKAKLRVPHSMNRREAISRGMQESPKLKPKREQAKDVEVTPSGGLLFKKPKPPLPYRERIAYQTNFEDYVGELIYWRKQRTHDDTMSRIRSDKGWYYGRKYDMNKVINEYERRIRMGLKNGTLIQDGDYLYQK